MEENLENQELELENLADGDEAAEEEIPAVDSKYRMILLAAQRSKQLQRGANPRVNADPRKIKPTRIAMEELKQKKVRYKVLDQE